MIHQWQRNNSALIFQEKRYLKNKLLLLLLLLLYAFSIDVFGTSVNMVKPDSIPLVPGCHTSMPIPCPCQYHAYANTMPMLILEEKVICFHFFAAVNLIWIPIYSAFKNGASYYKIFGILIIVVFIFSDWKWDNTGRVVASKFSVPGIFWRKTLLHWSWTNLYQNGKINLN